MHNITVIYCSTAPLVTRLLQSIQNLTAKNEEQNVVLEDARAEIEELKEFIKSVSILTRLLKR